MPTVNEFGEIFATKQLRDAVSSTLEKWYPSYLRRLEIRLGLPAKSVKNPVKYNNRNAFTALKGEALPRVVVISPGVIGQPMLNGRTYSAVYRVGVGVACAAQDEETATRNAEIYGAAARAIILHKRGLGTNGEDPPFIRGIQWIDESFNDLPINHQTLLYKAAEEWFAIEVDSVIYMNTGPAKPDQTEYPDYGVVPDIDHIHIDTEILAAEEN